MISTLRMGDGADAGIANGIEAAAQRWRTLPRAQVAGRTRAGRTTVAKALGLQHGVETAPVDEPGFPDPVLDADIVVYVLASTPSPGDRRLLASLRPERTILVLNKADAIGTGWADAVEAARQYAREFGLPTFPMVGSLAARTVSGAFQESDLALLRRLAESGSAVTVSAEAFVSPAAGPDTADRTELLERWDLYGLACVLAALEREPDLAPRTVLQILHTISGIEPVARLLGQRYQQAISRRAGTLIDELTRLAARAVPHGQSRARALITEYLDTDEARWLALCGGLVDPEVSHLAAGYARPEPDDADDALARAVRWRAVVAGEMSPAARRAAVRVHNGYVRMWERMSSVGL
ncbi:GTPase domain-containing protein [Nocardia sp. NBC_00416]|uniref:GTPase domain-containing protein n=1 Tax=Nocardia sp. NBC_00416 TaxID=2975991 RepID=UPI002E1BD7B3